MMRTRNGQIWYTVSDDHGHSWRPTEMLRFKDDGEPMENPCHRRRSTASTTVASCN